MKKLLPALVMAGVCLSVLLWWGGRTAVAQMPLTRDEEADSLIEKIRAARAKQEPGVTGKKTEKKIELSTPAERKPSGTAAEEQPRPKEAREPLNVITDPYEYLQSIGPLESLQRYDIDRTPAELLERIREARSVPDRSKAKTSEGKQATERPAAPEPTAPDYRQGTPDYSLENKYLNLLRDTPTAVGADVLGPQASTGKTTTDVRRSTSPTDLPDPNKDLDTYERVLRERYGARGTVSPYADPSLQGTYEAGRFRNWLSGQYDARVEPTETDVPKLSNVYKQFESLPEASQSLGRRDAYVPFSQNFVNNAYRGSIYDRPYSSDPYRSNYGLASQSKYSNLDYYNLNTTESFSDYYQREYGVTNAFVPGSTSRQYDVNTMKQWGESLRRDYGVDVRTGSNTYADLYRLYTSK